MTSEKIVVALLLIAIVLSIVSVIVTFSLNVEEPEPKDTISITEDDNTGQVSFEITDSTGGTG